MQLSRSVGSLVVVLGLLTTGLVGGTTIVDPDGDGVAPVAELRDGTAVFGADTDGDGLDDGDEQRYGTDPTVSDTDGDGLSDGQEVVGPGTNPLETDSDGDGLDDASEVRDHNTNPTASDTDGDGIDDGAEVTAYGTDPSDADSDADGLGDGEEVFDFETDPLAADSDADGLSDADELERYETDPVAADTDADGLEDGAEIRDHDSDPREADSDGDGLEDGTEVFEHGTDPTTSDTDGDGLTDGAESRRQDLYPDADPLRTDIFVEVDTMERTEFRRAEADRIVTEFENAPLENPDGSTGASLHFVRDETIPWASATDDGDLNGHRTRNFDRLDQGYHYLVIVENVAGDTAATNIVGKAGLGTMMVESQPERDETGSTVMHELGHSLGLSTIDYDGIDSEEYGFWRYRSVMNYNAPPDYYGFSEGGLTGFDDWGHIHDHMYTPSTSAVTVDR
ncbi:hypothetical protein [Natrinema halophilum]|uniref:Thrombospondin type 3 repeat-containing protein n=1 Tax=Natrinema halophilum TaxID=1699371 RepID=A0A7D5KK44_9EURY|nr:hypothetical protein [Natrinema halophilum]QLG48718.1 hypothetical protein HYG82_07590 [Natrinema halophilum]